MVIIFLNIINTSGVILYDIFILIPYEVIEFKRIFAIIIWKAALLLLLCFHDRLWHLWLWCVTFRGHVRDFVDKVYAQDLQNCQNCTKYRVQGHLPQEQKARENVGDMTIWEMTVIDFPSFCSDGNRDMKVVQPDHCLLIV